MSILHFDKSVLTLHLREVLEDNRRANGTALLGVGALLIGAVTLPTTVKLAKPVLKQAIKTSLLLSGAIPPKPTPRR